MSGRRREQKGRATRAAILAGALVWLAAGSAFAGRPMPETPFDIPQGAYQATFIEDTNQITHMEFVGEYDRDLPGGAPNLPARAVVAQEFFRTHPDEYDFLVTFTTFEFETGDAVAFHQGVRNDVEGIGLPIYDNSQVYGSDGRLRGFIEMAAASRYELNPLAPDYEFVLTTLAHETLHQWGTFVEYLDSTGQPSKVPGARQAAERDPGRQARRVHRRRARGSRRAPMGRRGAGGEGAHPRAPALGAPGRVVDRPARQRLGGASLVPGSEPTARRPFGGPPAAGGRPRRGRPADPLGGPSLCQRWLSPTSAGKLPSSTPFRPGEVAPPDCAGRASASVGPAISH